MDISLNTYSQLPDNGACTILCHYAVTVDVRSGASNHRLYGFHGKDERETFRALISVSGVSATLAMTVLSSLEPAQLQRAILGGDTKTISSVKGIGPKLAQRMVVELRDKLGGVGDEPLAVNAGGNTKKGEALSALSSLGVEGAKAERVLQGILDTAGNDVPLEELIRAALKEL